MTNAKLINSMLKCDGTTKNCVECVFQGIPECRNAMAHHAGALIQLQDVVLDNAAAQSTKQIADLRKLKLSKKQQEEAADELKGILTNVLHGLREERHCASCERVKSLVDPDEEARRQLLCKKCKAEDSLYVLDLSYGKPESPCESCEGDSDDCEGCQYNPENE